MKIILIVKRLRQRLIKKYQKDYNDFLTIKKVESNPAFSASWYDFFRIHQILQGLLPKNVFSATKEIYISFSRNSQKPIYNYNISPKNFLLGNLIEMTSLVLTLFCCKLLVRLLGNLLLKIDFKNLNEKLFLFILEARLMLIQSLLKLNPSILKIVDFFVPSFTRIENLITYSRGKRKNNQIILKKSTELKNIFINFEKSFLESKSNKEEIIIELENLLKKLSGKFFALGNFIQRLIRRCLISSCYFVPLMYIGLSTIAFDAQIHPELWNYSAIKTLMYLPGLCNFLFPIIYSGFDIFSSGTFNLVIILSYVMLSSKGKKSFGLALDIQQNIALGTVFFLSNLAINLVKQFLDFMVEPFPFAYRFLYSNLVTFVFFNFFLLLLLTLIYNCIVFLVTGKNPDIPILTSSAKRYMEQG